MDASSDDVAAALALLDKRRLVLAIHDASFPGAPGEDFGRGSPYSKGGLGLVRFARSIGFDGVQLGPQGQTTLANQSPYDGTLFSKCVLSVDFARLAEDPRWEGIVRREEVDALIASHAGAPEARVRYADVFTRVERLSGEAWDRFAVARAQGKPGAAALSEELAAFRRANADWLDRDGLYEVLAIVHGDGRWRSWPDEDRLLWSNAFPGGEAAGRERRAALLARHRAELERWALFQMVVHGQHARFREEAGALGVKLFGDVQVGLSPRDAWGRQALIFPSYRLGAPPSRTNPEGQPWSHSVMDPEQYLRADGTAGPVVDFVRARLGKMLGEFDGLRIDHPHGVVCPWVYRADDPDPFHAVQHGARLFESPDLADHPGLARYAIARAEQLDRSRRRHADGWLRELDGGQVDRYAILFDALVDEARRHGRDAHDILCEVLSTQPYPLARVMERHGLGRFRVTQKANVHRADDVYRSENARPEDWVMVGNHDTEPLWALVDAWHGTDAGGEQAEYLGRRLRPAGGGAADALARELRGDARKLAHAKMADLFVSRARNVMVFFPDLFGVAEVYNQPGTVSEQNWTLRVPADFEARYAADVADGRAVDLPCALSLAMRARGEAFASAHAELLARLEAAAWWVPGP